MSREAIAQTYKAGYFTVTVKDTPEKGKVYNSCDTQGKCITLYHGTAWRNGNRRGITWENGDYVYSISWSDSWSEGYDNSQQLLTVYRGDRLLVKKPLVLIK